MSGAQIFYKHFRELWREAEKELLSATEQRWSLTTMRRREDDWLLAKQRKQVWYPRFRDIPTGAAIPAQKGTLKIPRGKRGAAMLAKDVFWWRIPAGKRLVCKLHYSRPAKGSGDKEKAALPLFLVQVQQGGILEVEETMAAGARLIFLLLLERKARVSWRMSGSENAGGAQACYAALLKRKAHMHWQGAWWDASRVRVVSVAKLVGAQSLFRARAGWLLPPGAESEWRVSVKLAAPHAQGEIRAAGVGSKASRSFWSAQGTVTTRARGATLQEWGRFLKFGVNAEIHARPSLQVLHPEADGKHGFSVEKLDSRAVFYLQARGMDVRRAHHLLAEGFWREALGQKAAWTSRLQPPPQAWFNVIK
jgi:hypothetical protein